MSEGGTNAVLILGAHSETSQSPLWLNLFFTIVNYYCDISTTQYHLLLTEIKKKTKTWLLNTFIF